MGDAARQIRTERARKNLGGQFLKHRKQNRRIGSLVFVDIHIKNNVRNFGLIVGLLGRVISCGNMGLIKLMFPESFLRKRPFLPVFIPAILQIINAC